jgi:hypothetical protein
MNIETMKTKLAVLKDEASDVSIASFFPHPDFTPKRREAKAMKLGSRAIEIATAADKAGETTILRQALDIAKNMKGVVERARTQPA